MINLWSVCIHHCLLAVMATHENLSKKKEKRENPYQTIYRNKLFFLENWPRFPYFSPSESMRKQHDNYSWCNLLLCLKFLRYLHCSIAHRSLSVFSTVSQTFVRPHWVQPLLLRSTFRGKPLALKRIHSPVCGLCQSQHAEISLSSCENYLSTLSVLSQALDGEGFLFSCVWNTL